MYVTKAMYGMYRSGRLGSCLGLTSPFSEPKRIAQFWQLPLTEWIKNSNKTPLITYIVEERQEYEHKLLHYIICVHIKINSNRINPSLTSVHQCFAISIDGCSGYRIWQQLLASGHKKLLIHGQVRHFRSLWLLVWLLERWLDIWIKSRWAGWGLIASTTKHLWMLLLLRISIGITRNRRWLWKRILLLLLLWLTKIHVEETVFETITVHITPWRTA